MKCIVIFAMVTLSGSGTALASDASVARDYLEAAVTPGRQDWLREEMRNHIEKNLDEWTSMGLVGAAIEMASRHNDLAAYNYLVARLNASTRDEEKVDIIGKLSLWPGMNQFKPTTKLVLESLQSRPESPEVLERVRRALVLID